MCDWMQQYSNCPNLCRCRNLVRLPRHLLSSCFWKWTVECPYSLWMRESVHLYLFSFYSCCFHAEFVYFDAELYLMISVWMSTNICLTSSPPPPCFSFRILESVEYLLDSDIAFAVVSVLWLGKILTLYLAVIQVQSMQLPIASRWRASNHPSPLHCETSWRRG